MGKYRPCPLCGGETWATRPDISRVAGDEVSCASRGCELLGVWLTDAAWQSIPRPDGREVLRIINERNEAQEQFAEAMGTINRLTRERDTALVTMGEIQSALRAWAQTDRGQHASGESMEAVAEHLGLPADWDDPWWREGTDGV